MRIRDLGRKKFGSRIRNGKNSDPASGIDIPDPQHWSGNNKKIVNPGQHADMVRNTYFGRCKCELSQPGYQPADRLPSQLAAQLAGRCPNCAVAAASWAGASALGGAALPGLREEDDRRRRGGGWTTDRQQQEKEGPAVEPHGTMAATSETSKVLSLWGSSME